MRTEDWLLLDCIVDIVGIHKEEKVYLDKRRIELLKDIFEVHSFYKYVHLKEAPSQIVQDAIELHSILHELLTDYYSMWEDIWAKEEKEVA